MNNEDILKRLIEAYKASPPIFHATSYWSTYEEPILHDLKNLDLNELRSGKYQSFKTFGFNEVIYSYPPGIPVIKKSLLKLIHKYIIGKKNILPYGIGLDDLREVAFRHCELYSEITGSKSISSIEADKFGNPEDLFIINEKNYSVLFLNYYLRYCFANKYVRFQGNETIVELGSGSGHQVEILKKLYPGLTILCFDMPAEIWLAQKYLSEVFKNETFVKLEETIDWNDLSGIRDGHIHFLGNWQMPLLEGKKFDLFWNAASFGEMEPEVVKNYLKYVTGNANWIYLLQARYGKQTKGKAHVNDPISFGDYIHFLNEYSLAGEKEAFNALQRTKHAGGYFEAIFRINK
jgi:putative sugar O-methyltransferase